MMKKDKGILKKLRISALTLVALNSTLTLAIEPPQNFWADSGFEWQALDELAAGVARLNDELREVYDRCQEKLNAKGHQPVLVQSLADLQSEQRSLQQATATLRSAVLMFDKTTDHAEDDILMINSGIQGQRPKLQRLETRLRLVRQMCRL